ncbi:MAG: hypothetical protein ACP5P4_11080 [Steroidobacteraceae bacterium]
MSVSAHPQGSPTDGSGRDVLFGTDLREDLVLANGLVLPIGARTHARRRWTSGRAIDVDSRVADC